MTEQQSINLAPWVTPTFELISVNLECTAYAATLEVTDEA